MMLTRHLPKTKAISSEKICEKGAISNVTVVTFSEVKLPQPTTEWERL